MEMRAVYAECLAKMMEEDRHVCVLDADLSKASGTRNLYERFPKQMFDCGVAEQNMASIAAGLASYGFKPYIESFTPFATRRICDQIAISIVYAKSNVKVVGTDPGISAELNGGTHMSMEDIGVLRSIPGIVIFEPVDEVQLRAAMPVINDYDGCVYIRLFRKSQPVIFGEDYKFDLFKADTIREGSDVTIVAGCGIHNCGSEESRHDGLHTFHIGKNSRVHYIEKHYGEKDAGQTGGNIMNPKTVVYLGEKSTMQMDTIQIRGIDSTKRDTRFYCEKGSEVVVTERLLTHGDQMAESDMTIQLNGDDAKGRVISRSVAQDRSHQVFHPVMVGNAKCFGHVQCDSIIMGEAKIESIPAITANCPDAQLIHEAAIGKIAGDQLLKLETLGLTPEEAEETILKGFLA